MTEAAIPGDRLAALAAYLGLDWPWLWRRCADLGEHGCAGLVYPRSRLLSTNAVDAALRFTGMLGRNAAARKLATLVSAPITNATTPFAGMIADTERLASQLGQP